MRPIRAGIALCALATALAGCGAPAYQREHLADRIVSLETTAEEEGREIKWLEAREGATGGGGGAGGGCACN